MESEKKEENTIYLEDHNRSQRQPLSDQQKELYLAKISPYLKQGLSINKACIQGGVPKSTVYDLMRVDEDFKDKVEQAASSVGVIANNIVVSVLFDIAKKQSNYRAYQENPDTYRGNGKIEPKPLSDKEISFVQWFVTTNKNTKEEYSNRIETTIFDPQAEISKMMASIEEMISNSPAPTEAEIVPSSTNTEEESEEDE